METPDHRQRTLRDLRAKLDAIRHPPAPAARVQAPVRAAMPTLRHAPAAAPQAALSARAPAAIVYRRDLPFRHAALRPALAPATGSRKPVTLDQVVDGREVVHLPHGPFFLITTAVADRPGLPDLRGPFRRLAADNSPGLPPGPARPAEPAPASSGGEASPLRDVRTRPGELLFLDLETTGLTCSPLFLIGAMVWDGDGFEVRQYFARHYAEEPAVIAAFLDLAASRKALVTFNGKTFDWPFLRMRAAATAIPLTLEFTHLDLLHEARRRWKGVLPDCRLQTLESRLCGRSRYGDIPGCEIPDAYHAFVRTGHARMMADVLKHNLMDLVTLAELLLRLDHDASGPHAADSIRSAP